MKTSLFARLYTTLSFFILIIFSVTYYFTIKTYRQHYINSTRETMRHAIENIRPDVQKYFHNPDILQKKITGLAHILNLRITIIGESGRVIADSEQHPDKMDNHLSRPEIIQAISEKTGFSLRYSVTVHQDMVYYAEREVRPFGGFIRTSIYLSNITGFLNIFKENIIFVAIILLILSLGGAFLLTSSIADPIERLAHASNQIAAGNFDVSIGEFKNEELSELADNFRAMAKEIKKLFQNISHQKEELSSIIEAVNDKLLIIGADGTILSANKNFDDIVESKELVGWPYTKVITNKKIFSVIKKTIKRQTGLIDEIEINNKVYLCSSAFLPDIGESVLVLRDISELKNLENIKRDLIANASHELRTPLTAIKGFLETLIEEETGPKRKYLEIIERHTDRLIYIVQDLLILSRLEDKNIQPEFQSIKLKHVVDDTMLLLEKKAAAKGLYLVVDEKKEIVLTADRNLLVQLLVNLIDNAIKYTENGGVTIVLDKNEAHALISIIDTGIGIEKKHLSRLFERFYVVDSSRSRSQGGTGLGLSIVKHVVSKHNGTVDIESIPENGTKIRLKLPLTQSMNINENKTSETNTNHSL